MASIKSTAHTCRIEVIPGVSLIDEPVEIRLSGLVPGQAVTIRARTQDEKIKKNGEATRWVSHATFVADEQGNVHVDSQKPIAGTYSEIDPLGLFWSMSQEGIKYITFFTKSQPSPMKVTLTVESANTIIASTSIQRLFAAPGVTEQHPQEHGLVGTLFLPATPGPHPAALVLNGSDGGMHENAAALLASRGYAAFALAYFKSEGTPKQLKEIPLEYFEHAISWLQKQPEVAADKVAIIGLSRGGELALLLGATIPAVQAVVAGAPSGIMQSAVNSGTTAAWTYHGEPLPFPVYKPTFLDVISMVSNSFKSVLFHKPFTMKAGFIKLLEKEAEVAAATIPVEQTQGPILLLSGQQDQLWPSSLFAEKVMERLRAHNYAYAYTHLSYAEAGHFVCFPYGLPSLPPMVSLSFPGGFCMTFGGSPRANADAANDSWQKILAFLQQSLLD